MSRHPRRITAAIGVLLLPLPFAACGAESGSAKDSESAASASAGIETGDQLDEVQFSGKVGDELKVTWKSAVDFPKETSVTTLVQGSGDQIAEGDTVNTYLWVGNGTSQKDVYNDYDYRASEAIPNSPEMGEVWTQVFKGATYGSRVVAVTTAAELFGNDGSDNPFGIGVDESVVLVADIVDKQVEAPTPSDDKAHDADPGSLPQIVEKDGKPTGLDFDGIEEPELDVPVQRVILTEGDGAPVKPSDTVTVNYLGATHDAEAPFDESFSKEPLTSPLSGLIKGWAIGLDGVKVGSRVLIQIPPAYGYGAQGSGSIPANATLWFVVDVIKAK